MLTNRLKDLSPLNTHTNSGMNRFLHAFDFPVLNILAYSLRHLFCFTGRNEKPLGASFMFGKQRIPTTQTKERQKERKTQKQNRQLLTFIVWRILQILKEKRNVHSMLGPRITAALNACFTFLCKIDAAGTRNITAPNTTVTGPRHHISSYTFSSCCFSSSNVRTLQSRLC